MRKDKPVENTYTVYMQSSVGMNIFKNRIFEEMSKKNSEMGK